MVHTKMDDWEEKILGLCESNVVAQVPTGWGIGCALAPLEITADGLLKRDCDINLRDVRSPDAVEKLDGFHV